ncbi:MAG: serine hydrolase domain-containing protein, partial [Gemmatimonadaceae bacterium]
MNPPPLLAAALLVLTAALPVRGQAAYPGRTWPTAEPRAVGINVVVLDSIDSEITSGRYGYVDRMLVIRNARVVYDKSYKHDYDRIYQDSAKSSSPLNPHHLTGPYNYYHPWWHPYYRRGDLHTLQSVTKTITSVVIGTAIQRGDFPSIDSRVLSFFDTTKVKNIDDRKRRMT